MRVLVTGGAGFLGSALVRALLARGDDVVVLDALTYAGRREHLDGLDAPLIVGDVRDPEACRRALVGVDTVVHCAAETHVDRSLVDPLAFVRTNVEGTQVLLKEAARSDVERFHHVSTDEVYGSLAPGEPAWRPDAPLRPRNPYAASKAAADHLVWAACNGYGLPVSMHRAANTYGPRQWPEKLIPLFIERAQHGDRLPVYGDGRQVRDWLYVEDHAAAIAAMLALPAGALWHVAGGLQVENLALVDALCAALGVPPQIAHVADREGHDRRYDLDDSAFRAASGWSPAVGLEQGLRRTVAWTREHRALLQSITEGPAWRRWVGQRYA